MRGKNWSCYVQLFILAAFSFIFGNAIAETYYVSPTGSNNSYPGTINQPWATWQKAFNTAQAGDTVYLRGGTWYPTVQTNSVRSGTAANPICFFNYPGETPVLDCINFPTSSGSISGLDIYLHKYLRFKGLTIQNVRQTTPGQWISGISYVSTGGTVYFENMVSTGHGGTGIWIAGYDTLYLINCDSHHNCDSFPAPGSLVGGRADGYNITSGGTNVDTFKIAYVSGCRSWKNSDDGFDISSTKQLDVSNCWSFNNDLLSGDHTGFKFCYSHVLASGKRKVYNTISANNPADAYSCLNLVDPYFGPRMMYYNNTAYNCGTGFVNAPDAFNCASGKAKDIYRNNLVYSIISEYYSLFAVCNTKDYITLDHNNFVMQDDWPYNALNPTFSVTNQDFINLDVTQLSWPRKSDGSLPDITFLKLSAESDLIDGGVNVGLPFYGSAPDIGYNEYYVPGIPVTGITVSGIGGSTSITNDNGTLQLTATVAPSNATIKTVTWSIINGTGQATISSAGLVTAVSIGTVTARATANDGSGVYGQLQLTISNQVTLVTGITVAGTGGATSISGINSTLQLVATIIPANATNKTVTWSIINGTGQATISSAGLVTAVSNGTVTARATANDGSGVYGQLQITISDQVILVTGITVAVSGGATGISIDNGSLQLIATITPANATNKTVTWSVENLTGEVVISNSGLVTAIADGMVIASATANDGSSLVGTLNITISNQMTPIENHPPDISHQTFNIYESNPQEAFIGTILSYDSDAGQILDFTIESGNENGLFNIGSNTGNLYFSELPVDFYSNTQFSLFVRVTDNGEGELWDTAQVLINLIPSAKVYYIDPENFQDIDMDGSIEHPFDSWEKVSWEAETAYLQKRGTTSIEEKTIEITSGDVTIGAYSSGNNPEIISQTEEYAIQAVDRANITIRNMSIKAENALSSLYFLGEQCDNITIEYCTLENPEYGIRIVNGGAFYIAKNSIKQAINGIFLIADFAEINYNNFSGNQQAINLKTSQGDARIFNNVFCDNRKGIVADEAQTLIYNNIFYFTSASDYAIEHILANCYSDYNIYYPEQNGFVKLSGISYQSLEELRQLTTLDKNSIVEDPLLKDRIQNNYEILDGSPAIDAGIFIGPLEDMYGTAVPVGIAPDIGSCEKNDLVSDNQNRITTESDDGILVYPNPAIDYLTIENQNSAISYSYVEIFDNSGKVLMRNELSSLSKGSKVQLQLSKLSAGLYLMKIYGNKAYPVVKKIIID
jgi:uncharacterized protein YjdB